MLFGPPCHFHYFSCQGHEDLKCKNWKNEEREKNCCKGGETILQQGVVTVTGTTTSAMCD
jgi:hypothetical protein